MLKYNSCREIHKNIYFAFNKILHRRSQSLITKSEQFKFAFLRVILEQPKVPLSSMQRRGVMLRKILCAVRSWQWGTRKEQRQRQVHASTTRRITSIPTVTYSHLKVVLIQRKSLWQPREAFNVRLVHTNCVLTLQIKLLWSSPYTYYLDSDF